MYARCLPEAGLSAYILSVVLSIIYSVFRLFGITVKWANSLTLSHDDVSESWHNLSEETFMSNLPLDKNRNDIVMIGLDLDITNTGSYYHTIVFREQQELPFLLIMYASDETVVGWYFLNTSGNVYHVVCSRDHPCLWRLKP